MILVVEVDTELIRCLVQREHAAGLPPSTGRRRATTTDEGLRGGEAARPALEVGPGHFPTAFRRRRLG